MSADRLEALGVDANAASATASLPMGEAVNVGFYILANSDSDSHVHHISTLQVSPDDSTWFDTAHTITGLGALSSLTVVSGFVRVKITTPEGVASVVDIFLFIK